jgi:hypothetical protein
MYPIELPQEFPPYREVEHGIELIPSTQPMAKAPYYLSFEELRGLKNQLQELTSKGLIRPLKSPFGASNLFATKKDGIEHL